MQLTRQTNTLVPRDGHPADRVGRDPSHGEQHRSSHMFRPKRSTHDVRRDRSVRDAVRSLAFEPLEGRQFLSASPFDFHPHGGHDHGGPGGEHDQPTASITYDQAPAAVQSGLETLATTAGLSDPTSDQSVTLHNVDGVETYSLTVDGTGTSTTLTVDASGNAVTARTHSTTTFSTLSSAVQTELQTLATAKGVADTIASDQSVDVLTEANGTTLYYLTLSATTTDDDGTSSTKDVTLTVDSDGNPTTLPNSGPTFAADRHRGPRGGFGRPSFWSSTPIPENFLG